MDLKSLTSLIDLSENIKLTPEGYLVCCDVCLTAVGELLYAKEEYPEQEYIPGDDGMIRMVRTVDALSNPETIGSFIGKPVTFNHPDEKVVTVETWKQYSVGNIANPRFDGQGIVADLVITDAAAVELIKNSVVRQVSAGVTYLPHFVEAGICLATTIRCNHVALVREGRAGAVCMINDSKKGEKMGGLKQKLMALLTMFNEVTSSLPDDATDEAPKENMKAEEAKQANDEEVIEGDITMDTCANKAMDAKYVSKDEFTASMSEIKSLLTQALPKKEEKTANDAAFCDEGTLQKAEVLCPGIKAQKDIKRVALDAAMRTEDGKEVIESIAIDGVSDANLDAVFNAAYMVLKDRRTKSMVNSLNDSKYSGQQSKDYFSVRAVSQQHKEFWDARKEK